MVSEGCRSVPPTCALAPAEDALESLGVLLENMCLCTPRYQCVHCVVGQLSHMVENLLEPEADTAMPLCVYAAHPITGLPFSCPATTIGRFTVVKLPAVFLDALTNPLTLPLPSSASDASDELSDTGSDVSVPATKLFPVFQLQSLFLSFSKFGIFWQIFHLLKNLSVFETQGA